MTQEFGDNDIRAIGHVISTLSNLASSGMGSKIQEIVSSPDFINSIKSAFVTCLNQPEFRENISNIFVETFSKLSSNKEITSNLVSVFSETAKDIFSNEGIKTQIKEVFINAFTSIFSSDEGQQVTSALIESFSESIKAVISEQGENIKDIIFGEEVKEMVKNMIQENMEEISSSITMGVQGALSSLAPKINVEAKMVLHEGS